MGPGSVANLLNTVIANPRIGSYVRMIELSSLMQSQAGWDQTNVYTEEELDLFTAAALDSECLEKPSDEEVEEKEFWSEAIEDGNEEILLAILLPLLPNLSTLTVEAGVYEQHAWYDSVIEKAASATKPTLCKLANINLKPFHGTGYNLTQIQKFSALPSVRVLTAPKAFGVVGSLLQLCPDTNSNVTQLELWENCIHSIPLYEFLRGFPRLQSFTYSSESYDYEKNHYTVSHDAFWVRCSLLAHCKATLQDLTLLIPDRTHVSLIGSLRSFETLKEVYLEWSCLIPSWDDSYAPDFNEDGPYFNENLPESLVRLKIHDRVGREKSHYEQVIKRAQYAKEHRLKNLQWLIFEGIRVGWSLEAIDRGLRKTCFDMGFSLIF